MGFILLKNKKAEHAINEQKAKIVIYEFENFNSDILTRLSELKRKGYQAIWYESSAPNVLHYINVVI